MYVLAMLMWAFRFECIEGPATPDEAQFLDATFRYLVTLSVLVAALSLIHVCPIVPLSLSKSGSAHGLTIYLLLYRLQLPRLMSPLDPLI